MRLKNQANTAIMLSIFLFGTSVFASTIPHWLSNPTIKDGLAAVDCVKFSGNWSSDAKISSANARIALAQQIEVKVESLDKTYDTRVSNEQGTNVTTEFSSVSKQYTKQVLAGSRIVKTEMVEISNTDYYCALATLDPKQTEQVFKLILKASEKTLAPELEAELFEQFKSAEPESTRSVDEIINKP